MLLNKILQVLQLILKIVGIVALSAVILSFIALNIDWRIFYTETDAVIPSDKITPSPQLQITPTQIVIDTNVESIYNADISRIDLETKENKFIEYFNKVIDTTDNTWNGEQDDLLRITVDDFSESELIDYKEWISQYNSQKQIPIDKFQYYVNDESLIEIKEIIKEAQSDYFSYLDAIAIKSDYVNELRNNTAPAINERIEYNIDNLINNPDSFPDFLRDSNNDVINDDYSKLKLIIYANDIYKYSKYFESANLLNTDSISENDREITYRNMALRFITYRLMTNALQRAVDTVNSPDKYKTDKDSYLKAIDSLSDFPNNYELEWGGVIYNNANNRLVNLKRQANYVAFEVFNTVYRLSSAQRSNLYITLWEDYEDLGTELRNTITKFNQLYPTFPIDNIRTKLISDFISNIDNKNLYKQSLTDLNNQFLKITNYVADYTYFKQGEAYAFWDYLK